MAIRLYDKLIDPSVLIACGGVLTLAASACDPEDVNISYDGGLEGSNTGSDVGTVELGVLDPAEDPLDSDPTQVARIRFLNLSTPISPAKVYVDDCDSVIFNNVEYENSTGYIEIEAGQHSIYVFEGDEVCDTEAVPLLYPELLDLNFEGKAEYTIYIFEKDSFTLPIGDEIVAVVLRDDTTEPSENSARVRPVHAAAGLWSFSGPLDFLDENEEIFFDDIESSALGNVLEGQDVSPLPPEFMIGVDRDSEADDNKASEYLCPLPSELANGIEAGTNVNIFFYFFYNSLVRDDLRIGVQRNGGRDDIFELEDGASARFLTRNCAISD